MESKQSHYSQLSPDSDPGEKLNREKFKLLESKPDCKLVAVWGSLDQGFDLGYYKGRSSLQYSDLNF